MPGGAYDRDGFLYRHHVDENLEHDRFRHVLGGLLRANLRRRYGDRALVTGDCGLYGTRADRSQKPLAPDILVSLTAGGIRAPDTPPRVDRKSYKLWQEPVPDLVLEVISSSSVTCDTMEKPRLYERLGIPEFWLFDPHGEADLPGGLAGWLLVDGPDLHLHDPATGRLRDLDEEIEARMAAEARAGREAKRVAALEAELRALRGNR